MFDDFSEFQQFALSVRKISKSLRLCMILKFPEISQRKLLNFSEIGFQIVGKIIVAKKKVRKILEAKKIRSNSELEQT